MPMENTNRAGCNHYVYQNILAVQKLYGPQREKTFVSCFLESIISKLTTNKISVFQQVSLAAETGLSLTLSETLKTGFLAPWPILLSSMKSFFDSLPASVIC